MPSLNVDKFFYCCFSFRLVPSSAIKHNRPHHHHRPLLQLIKFYLTTPVLGYLATEPMRTTITESTSLLVFNSFQLRFNYPSFPLRFCLVKSIATKPLLIGLRWETALHYVRAPQFTARW